MKKLFFLALVVIIGFTGCGYTTKSALPSHLKTIHIKQFTNKIDFTRENQRNLYLPLLEVDVTNAVIDRYLFDGNLRLQENEKQADLVLTGELIGYERRVLRYTDNDDPEEYRVNIIVKLTLWDNQFQTVRWTENRFIGDAEYFITGSLATTEASAVDEAVVDLARRIVERTIEDW